MSSVRTLAFRLIRTYASKPFTKAAGIRGKHKLDLLDEPEEIDYEDVDAYTSDFMNIAESHKMHGREIEKSKEKLKQRIVKSKYFKEMKPKFLTFMEKDQIQKLHESDPVEWTPETLSKSFPALPETIRSVLKAKWTPKSIDRIIKFDTEVVNNWKNFKSGRLVVNPILHEHLMKFKNRKIVLPNREDLSKTLVPPKIEFQKPRSTMFSNILVKTVKEKQPVHDQKLISSKSETNMNKQTFFTINKDDLEKSMVQVNNSDYKKTYKRKPDGKILSFNEFMKLELEELYKKSPEEGITLLQTYRKYVESANLEAVKSEESINLEAVKSEESTNLEVVKSEESTNSMKQVNKENITPTESLSTVHDQKLISFKSEINMNKQTFFTINKDDLENSMVQVNNSDYKKTYKWKPDGKILSFNEFMKLELKELYKKSPEEGRTLLQTYRKYVESANLEVVKSEESTNLEAVKSEESTNLEAVKSEESTNLEVVKSEEATNSMKQVNKENITSTESLSTEYVPVVEENETQAKVVSALNRERGSGLDTYVKDRKTDIDTKFEYTKPIKIPKNVWKQGMTYRVKDCYYDDDGEFLYRVPGLRL
ncbi:uncharacterized protein LOC143214154 [Lasioglossum baleicum]|uniref:uncharacterized protein LOC143214154 n=1 Tax=Lasioglossum baleicum TaxID=434251 RepID=UPI003FCD7B21